MSKTSLLILLDVLSWKLLHERWSAVKLVWKGFPCLQHSSKDSSCWRNWALPPLQGSVPFCGGRGHGSGGEPAQWATLKKCGVWAYKQRCHWAGCVGWQRSRGAGRGSEAELRSVSLPPGSINHSQPAPPQRLKEPRRAHTRWSRCHPGGPRQACSV